MERSHSYMLAITLVVMSFLVLVGAMHEDEQGKYDWYFEGIGYASRAAFHPRVKGGIKAVYTISQQSAVAAIGLLTGKIKWRRVLTPTDPLVCVSASDAAVFVGSASGIIHEFDPRDGALLNSYTISAVETPKSLLDCRHTREGLDIVSISSSGAKIHITRQDETGEHELAWECPVGAHVTRAILSSSHMWASLDDGTILAFKLSPAALTPLAHYKMVDPNGARLTVASKDYVAIAVGTRHQLLHVEGSTISVVVEAQPDFPNCATVVMDEDAEPATTAPSLASCMLEQGSLIAVKHGETKSKSELTHSNIPERDWSQDTRILAARRVAKGEEMLIRTSDGNLHFIKGSESGWSRPDGMSQVVLAEFAELPSSMNVTDPFGFERSIVLMSEHGRLYTVLASQSAKLLWTSDVLADVHKNSKDRHTGQFTPMRLSVDGLSTTVSLRKSSGETFTVEYETASGNFLSIKENPLGDPLLLKYDRLSDNENVAPTVSFYHTVNESSGVLRGYVLPAEGQQAVLAWEINLNATLVAVADGHDPLVTSSVDSRRVFPNPTTKLNEVRTKYPMSNVMACAFFEEHEDSSPTLNVMAIDCVSGQVLSTVRHEDVEGKVLIMIAEHAVIYHFLNVRTMRHYIGVWELFVHEEGTTATDADTVSPAIIVKSFFSTNPPYSSLSAANPPTVFSQLLGFPGHVDAMALTKSYHGIARKMVIFALSGGQVVATELRSLLFGGQPVTKDQRMLPLVPLPSHQYLTYKYTVHQSRLVVTSPTELESTSHVLAVGLDLFYTRCSAAKPFDMLDDDFNWRSLMMVVAGLTVAAVVLRFWSNRKALAQQWE